jgi:hypothetical protein
VASGDKLALDCQHHHRSPSLTDNAETPAKIPINNSRLREWPAPERSPARPGLADLVSKPSLRKTTRRWLKC